MHIQKKYVFARARGLKADYDGPVSAYARHFTVQTIRRKQGR